LRLLPKSFSASRNDTATPGNRSRQDERYAEAAQGYSAALERLARAYEANPDKRRDLLQEIHVAIWRSFARFDEKCSMRTWVYRVAHNTATSQITRKRATQPTLISIDDISAVAHDEDHERVLDRQRTLQRLMTLIHQLKPLDRQIVSLYLEDLDASAISDVTGISPGNVATKIHRIKKLLAERFQEGLPSAD
jgi:RNA polymerase sigma-70 factor (ECF subfamily)